MKNWFFGLNYTQDKEELCDFEQCVVVAEMSNCRYEHVQPSEARERG
jgi:hypothetical protein